jgi:hypothetical protein
MDESLVYFVYVSAFMSAFAYFLLYLVSVVSRKDYSKHFCFTYVSFSSNYKHLAVALSDDYFSDIAEENFNVCLCCFGVAQLG